MRPIHHTFGPLATDEQCKRALAITYTPWKYVHGGSTGALERDMSSVFDAPVFLFGSGREALLAILRAMKIRKGDEVIVQAYTCIVVPNAIHAAGAKTVYCDIDRDTLNLDIDTLEQCITSKTRVVICQHTFGIPANTPALRKICDKHKILLIEDCAHVLPDTIGPTEIGHHGDVLFTSFGRDKAISGVTGGAVIVRNRSLANAIKDQQARAVPPSWLSVHRLIHYPLVYRRALPLYPLGIGKALVRLQRLIGNLPPIVTPEEKKGTMPPLLHTMPNACAYFAVQQWRTLKELNDHRRTLTAYYLKACEQRGWLTEDSPVYVPKAIRDDLPLQKFPLFLRGAETIRTKLKAKQIYLDDGWTGCVVCPASADASKAGYEPGSDAVAEDTCERILSLPTHPTMSLAQAEYLMKLLAEEVGGSVRG